MSEWKALPFTQIQAFADATGDHQWIHVDKARIASESPFGAPIAHGYLTLSLVGETGPWNVALAATGKDVNVDGANGTTFDHQVQVSAGYAFANGFTLDVGYKRATAASISTQTLGAIVTYGIEF